MSIEQKRVRDYILENQTLPPEYDFVFINAAYETAINIRGKVDCVVVHTPDEDKVVQARNRYRGDLKVLYRKANAEQVGKVELPSEFVGVPLGEDEKQFLCEYYNLRKKCRNKLKWTSVKKLLKEQGWIITTKRPRINGKQVSRDIITWGGTSN